MMVTKVSFSARFSGAILEVRVLPRVKDTFGTQGTKSNEMI